MLISFIRSVILYLLLILVIRVMGKRQIGQMEASEFVVTMLIADLASVPMQNNAISLFSGLVPILAVLALELILSVASIKLLGVRRMLCGRPVILVEHGRISAENLRRTRVTLDELTGRLREQGILDPATVNYAILETNGQLSVFPYAKYRRASAMDAGIEARDESLPVTVIADGRILRDNLRLTGRDRTWLDGCLRAQKCRRKDVLLLTVDGSGVVHMQRKGTRK